jgi:sirohydrochlorin ferrochelatase
MKQAANPVDGRRSALLIVAHGSRKTSSNLEVMTLARQVAESPDNPHDITEYAFLELTQPGVAETIDALVAQQCTQITVVPYFLAAGRHVVEDLPEVIQAKQAQYPALRLNLTQHLGCSTEMTQLILKLT